MRMRNKVCVVTGGAAGFGEAIAKRFAAEGANVVVADINDDAGAKVADEIGVQAEFVHADVTVESEVKDLIARARHAFGKLDVVVNNAGFSHRNCHMLDVKEHEFDRIFEVNVKGIYFAAKHAIPEFKSQGGGMFLNIASTVGVRPPPNLTWYNASKGAVIIATKSMAVELAPFNIRSCAINPSIAETDMLPLFMGEDTLEKREKFREGIPLGRLCQPKDVASAALYLCSDDAEFITGVCLEVDGGRCI